MYITSLPSLFCYAVLARGVVTKCPPEFNVERLSEFPTSFQFHVRLNGAHPIPRKSQPGAAFNPYIALQASSSHDVMFKSSVGMHVHSDLSKPSPAGFVGIGYTAARTCLPTASQRSNAVAISPLPFVVCLAGGRFL